MSRALFWILLALLIYFALRSKLRAAARNSRCTRRRSRSAPPAAAIENMTSCAHCGLHFPASEALHADGRDYCCPAHLHLPPP